LTEDEYNLIREYGGKLEHFWLETLKNEENQNQEALLLANPAALIADVATDPNGQALEEATGLVDEIYVVFPRDGELVVGTGGVYSYYEFAVPLSERMTDEDWRNQLGSSDAPARPEWENMFLTE
jgi:hypothetical protein